MTNITTKPDSSQPKAETAVQLFEDWFDPIETGVRERVHEFIEAPRLTRPRLGAGANQTGTRSAPEQRTWLLQLYNPTRMAKREGSSARIDSSLRLLYASASKNASGS